MAVDNVEHVVHSGVYSEFQILPNIYDICYSTKTSMFCHSNHLSYLHQYLSGIYISKHVILGSS